jgi:adenylate cyclase
LRDAEKIFEEVGAEDNIANVYANLAKTYLKLGKTKESIKYANNALTLSIVIGDKDQLKDAYENLAEVNAAMNNFKAAYRNEVLFKQVYDTIYNKENEKKLTQLQMQYDFDKKQDSTQAEQVRRDDVSHEVIKRQKQLKNAFIVGFVLLCLLALILYNRFRLKRKANLALEEKNQIISHEKLRSDNLLLNILPEEVAEELKNNGKIEAKEFESVTVMFTDFKDFTKISEQLTASQLVTEIDACFSAFDNIVAKYNIEKIKTIGDSYMCVGGLPKWSSNHAEDTVRAAIEIREFMLKHNNTKRANGEIPFEIRIGINTGHVVAGIVGIKKFAYDIWGDTVNLASRMESSSEPGKVNISGSTYELVKHKFQCEHRGKIMTKSKGEVEMYFVS